MLEKDFDWFVENHVNLYKQYGHCFLTIKDQQVLGAYASYAEAVHKTIQEHPLGTFIVQECTKDDSGFTNYISSYQIAVI